MIEPRDQEDVRPAVSGEWMLFQLHQPDGHALLIGGDQTTVPYFTGFELAEAFTTARGRSAVGLFVSTLEGHEVIDGILKGLAGKLTYAINPVSDKRLEILSALQFVQAIVCLAAMQDLVYYPTLVSR
jgi:hypothetical protein